LQTIDFGNDTNTSSPYGTTITPLGTEQWYQDVWIPIPTYLFTTGADTVDFNNLTSGQQAVIAGVADFYHGLGGSDVVTLPSEANYNENVGNGVTLGWTDTPASTFYTQSNVGDTYTVNGTDGSYYIVEGAGTEFITINGNGSSNITAGSGTDTITINGTGHSIITPGSGTLNATISGGPIYIAPTIDLTAVPHDTDGIATLGSNNVLQMSEAREGRGDLVNATSRKLHKAARLARVATSDYSAVTPVSGGLVVLGMRPDKPVLAVAEPLRKSPI
jgi:hypothetical protein